MSAILKTLSGAGLFARAARGAAITASGFAGMQVLGSATNLILTRLLQPEVFGPIALVSMLLVGLAMFWDVGPGSSISRHRQGGDPDFLNTAWTIQRLRGGLLWLGTCAPTWTAVQLCNAPQLLPVAGLTQVIWGLFPTGAQGIAAKPQAAHNG